MERKGIYDIKKVFDWIDDSSIQETEFGLHRHEPMEGMTKIKNGKEFKTKPFEDVDAISDLLGYTIFKEKGIDCCCCPTKGAYFALERTPGGGSSPYNQWHFNLYGIDKFGREVLLTKDHILAKSKGGTDDVENLQPMCMPCNTKKGSMDMDEFAKRKKDNTFISLDNAEQIIAKIKELYSVDMTLPEFGMFYSNMRDRAKLMHTVSATTSYRKVGFKKTDIFAVFSDGRVKSLIDPKDIGKRLFDVPEWGAGMEKECLDMYSEIAQSVKNVFLEEGFLKCENAGEQAEYLAKSKYPKLSFNYWKKDAGKVNVITWAIIKSLMIKDPRKIIEAATQKLEMEDLKMQDPTGALARIADGFAKEKARVEAILALVYKPKPKPDGTI
jgi:hypothetical protein